jgi:hypothetical protein
VLLLRTVAPHADPDLYPLLGAVVEQFKVIVPELPQCVVGHQPDVTAATAWMRGVLDGLGIDTAFMIVDSGLRWLVEALEAEDGDRIRATAVLADRGADSMRAAVAGLPGAASRA